MRPRNRVLKFAHNQVPEPVDSATGSGSRTSSLTPAAKDRAHGSAPHCPGCGILASPKMEEPWLPSSISCQRPGLHFSFFLKWDK